MHAPSQSNRKTCSQRHKNAVPRQKSEKILNRGPHTKSNILDILDILETTSLRAMSMGNNLH